MKTVAGCVVNVFLYALLSIGLSATAFATSFTGTILETITSTTNPAFSVGETALGYYQYESETVDGIFGTCNYFGEVFHGPVCQAASPEQFRQANLFGFVILFTNAFTLLPAIDFNLHSGITRPVGMTVTDGQVTGFQMEGETGVNDFSFNSGGFGVNTGGWPGFGPGGFTSGTMTFSDPVQAPEPSSLILLGLALLGLIAVKVRGNPSLKSQIQS